jgi:hypothetical protein
MIPELERLSTAFSLLIYVEGSVYCRNENSNNNSQVARKQRSSSKVYQSWNLLAQDPHLQQVPLARHPKQAKRIQLGVDGQERRHFVR